MGYTPIFHMPIIAPPTVTGASATYYTGLNVSVSATPTQTRQGIEITVSDPALATVYAMCGGEICLFPANAVLPTPDNQVAPTGGVLVLRAWAADFKTAKPVAPAGDQPAAYFYYFNLDGSSVAAAIEALVPTAVKQAILEKYWVQTHNTPANSVTHDMLTFNYASDVVAGKAWLFVDGGTALGKALPSGTGVKFQLERISAGNPQIYLSPAGTIRGVPAADKTVPLDRWNKHPLLANMDALPLPVDFHLRFTIWNPRDGVYSPLINASVDVVQTGPNGDATIATGTTDNTGRVNMAYADLSQIPGGQRALRFEIDLQTNQLHFDRNTGMLTDFPMTSWSTKGWKSADALWRGSYLEFSGSNVGTAAAPAEFRIGLDFHVRFWRKDSTTGTTVPFKEHQFISVFTRADASDAQKFTTDDNGRVEGVLYDVQDTIQNDIHFRVEYATARISNTGVLTKRAYFSFDTAIQAVDSETSFAIIGLPCPTDMGSSNFKDITVVDASKSDAIYALQCVEEVCAFVTYLSPTANLDWAYAPPDTGLAFFYVASGLSGHSSGIDSQGVHHDKISLVRSNWTGQASRDATLFHEIAHAVNKHLTWSLADQTNAVLVSPHSWNTDSNTIHAFLEGFAEFFSGLFVSISEGMFSGTTLADLLTLNFTNSSPYLLPKDNKGWTIEGAFAFALYLIVKRLVVSNNPFDLVLARSTGGDFDVVGANPWLSATGVQANFKSMIWDPLMSLGTAGVADTTVNFVLAVKNNNPVLWPKLKFRFNQTHIMVEEPLLARLTFGQALNGIALKNTAYQGVMGSGFVGQPLPGASAGYVDMMTVTFVSGPDSLAATNVAVQSDNAFTMDVPAPGLPPGVYDVVIHSAWADKTFPAFLTISN